LKNTTNSFFYASTPKLDGIERAKKTHEINPDIPVLICSGYSEKLDKTMANISNIKVKLDKPLQVEALNTKVRQLLD